MFGIRKTNLYIISVLIFITGLVLFFYSVKSNFTGLGSTLQKFEFPGEVEFTLNKDGMFSIYHEYMSTVNGEKIDNSGLNINSINVSLFKLPDNTQIDLKNPDSYKKYSYLGRDGVKMFQFENKGVNEYRLVSSLKDIKTPDVYVLSLEKGFEITRHKGILISQAMLLFPILISLFIFIKTYLRND